MFGGKIEMGNGQIYIRINTGEKLLEFSKCYVSSERDFIISCLKQITRNTSINRQEISKCLRKIKEEEINQVCNCGYIIITCLCKGKYSYYSYSGSIY